MRDRIPAQAKSRSQGNTNCSRCHGAPVAQVSLTQKQMQCAVRSLCLFWHLGHTAYIHPARKGGYLNSSRCGSCNIFAMAIQCNNPLALQRPHLRGPAPRALRGHRRPFVLRQRARGFHRRARPPPGSGLESARPFCFSTANFRHEPLQIPLRSFCP